MSATRSSLDSNRFGVEVYRASVDDLAGIDAAIAAPAALLIVRCAVERLDLAHALEARGARLCDTLIEYQGPTAAFAEHPANPGIRRAGPADGPNLERLARACFASFQGHYHRDPRLDPAAATEGYVEWCMSALTTAGDFVLVAQPENQLVGFLTARATATTGEILLNGVAPDRQRRGWYGALFDAAAQELAQREIPTVVVSTQLSNWAPQKVWLRRGLEPSGAQYTFHLWRTP